MAGQDSNTLFLSHFDGADGATTYTAETGQTVTFVGTAQLDDAQKKFGDTSLLLDGNSDYVTVPDSSDWTFGTGDWTIDFFVRFASVSGVQVFASQYEDGQNYWEIFKPDTTNKLRIYYVESNIARADFDLTDNLSLDPDTWYHVAFVRNGSNFYIFGNGVSLGLTENTALGDLADISSTLRLGYGQSTSGYLNGWIDEFRISDVARWTSNFIPPEYAYSESVPRSQSIVIS